MHYKQVMETRKRTIGMKRIFAIIGALVTGGLAVIATAGSQAVHAGLLN
jgi:hypothetical protein